MLHTILLILFIITFIAWLVWFAGYPIYIKTQHKIMNWGIYALITSIIALLINIINLFIKFTN